MSTGNLKLSHDHNRFETRGLQLQWLDKHPTDVVPEGFVYYNTLHKTAYMYTDVGWKDLGYLHEIYYTGDTFATALKNGQVIDNIRWENGHFVEVSVRSLTANDVGAASQIHSHAYNEVTNVPQNTVLGRKSNGTGDAEALTQSDLLAIIGIAIGTAQILQQGTDTAPRAWSAVDLVTYVSNYVSNALQNYLTKVDLSATHNTTNVIINNDAGTDATILPVNSTRAGVMIPAQNDKLAGIAPNANNYVHPTFAVDNDFDTAITAGLEVLGLIDVTVEGHAIRIKKRTITAADIAAVMIMDALQNNGTTWSSNKIVQHVDQEIASAQSGALKYQPTNYSASTTQGVVIAPPPITAATIKVGMVWVVTTGGFFGTDSVDPGDMLIAKVDNAGTTASNYQLVNKNIPAIIPASEIAQGIIQLATTPEALAGVDALKAITPKTLKAVLDSKFGSYVIDFGDGFTNNFLFQHNFGTQNINLVLLQKSNSEVVLARWLATSNNTATVSLAVPPTTNGYKAMIYKI